MGEDGGDPSSGVSGSLKMAIKHSGISISELSRRTGVARQAINRFLSGERGLTTETVDKLCEELGLELLPGKAAGGPPTRSQAGPAPEAGVRPRSLSDKIALFRCKHFLIQLNDKHPFRFNPVWSDILNRVDHHDPLCAFLLEVRGCGNDKQRAAIQCLMLSILEMNPICEKLLANEHLPGFLRYLVTQDEDPLCIGSLGAVLDTSDIYAWFNTLPDPDPDAEEWIG